MTNKTPRELAVELRPCPFCGHTDIRMMIGFREDRGYSLLCGGCGVRQGSAGRTEAEAIAAWNTRPQPTAAHGLADELEELRAFLDGIAPIAGAYFGDKRGNGVFWWRRYLDVMDKAAATLRQHPDTSEDAVERGWQPIETAPRDGTFVDLWVNNPCLEQGGQRVTDAAWLDGAWREWAEWDEDAEDRDWFENIGQTERVETDLCKATHWQPLPEPPAALNSIASPKADEGGVDAAI